MNLLGPNDCASYSHGMPRGNQETMKWRRLGRLVVTVHSELAPTEDEWSRYMGQADVYQPLEDQRILVVSEGGAPNGTQRQQLIELLHGARVPTAILSSSWLMRGSGAAVSWFNRSLRVFGPSALPQALEHLQLTQWERTESLRLLREFQNELGVRVIGAASLDDPRLRGPSIPAPAPSSQPPQNARQSVTRLASEPATSSSSMRPGRNDAGSRR
jgi:hypothetical protein